MTEPTDRQIEAGLTAANGIRYRAWDRAACDPVDEDARREIVCAVLAAALGVEGEGDGLADGHDAHWWQRHWIERNETVETLRAALAARPSTDEGGCTHAGTMMEGECDCVGPRLWRPSTDEGERR